ncbi:MAG: GNAT family N-acetyltransferase [Proteobacteria bacterium]|nr:GNAT family N-acetyltransferase [Desulfobulbaceae bacterium]MBU4154449.1 GNAT family N-acetyltransferase [Pseudomonadota bacterium]
MIRLFKKHDLVQLNQMIHKTIDYSYPAVYPDLAVLFFKKYHSENNILERFKKGKVLVFEKNGNIMATGSIVGNEITGVFVKPESQWHGLGREVMSALELMAQEMDIPEVTLSVSLPSKNFYENLNYKITEESQIDVGEGQVLRYWIASKNILHNQSLNTDSGNTPGAG